MRVLRLVVSALPQILILLLLGGHFDLLGGWNHTDSAFGVLLILFFFCPAAAIVLVILEFRHYLRIKKRAGSKPSFLMPGTAMILFFEAVLIDLFILSQVRMH